jgi:hypothetical protein
MKRTTPCIEKNVFMDEKIWHRNNNKRNNVKEEGERIRRRRNEEREREGIKYKNVIKY